MTSLTHVIEGIKVGGEPFPSSQGNFEILLPRLTEKLKDIVLEAAKNAQAPSLEERKRLILSLQNYQPSEEALEAASQLSGNPITLIKEMIEQGKTFLPNIASVDSKDSSKIMYVGIPANDPRENFYFVAHALLAGSPAILKPSSGEPVFARDLALFLKKQGLPDGFVNVVYADTNSESESKLLFEIMENVDIPIIMGSTQILPNQISFNADHSRALVLDAEYVIPNLRTSVMYPHSCLAEHNYIVVGQNNFDLVVDNLIASYKELKPGELTDEKSNMCLVDENILREVAATVRTGEMTDTTHLIYPQKSGTINPDTLRKGAIVRHFSEDYETGVNPFMVNPLPLYFTGVRLVDSLEQAIKDLQAAQKQLNNGAEKSMALGFYGEMQPPKEIQDIAFEISHNHSPFYVDGIVHQGMNLNEILTK